jgi:hypothetical protein
MRSEFARRAGTDAKPRAWLITASESRRALFSLSALLLRSVHAPFPAKLLEKARQHCVVSL